MNFPTCRTCKFFEEDNIGQQFYCSIQNKNFYDGWGRNYICYIIKPDSFFCSEHETKEGQRFVNWGTK